MSRWDEEHKGHSKCLGWSRSWFSVLFHPSDALSHLFIQLHATHTLSYSSKVLGSLIKTLTWHKKLWVNLPEGWKGCRRNWDFLSSFTLKALFPSKHFTLQFKHVSKACVKKSANHFYCVCKSWDIFTNKYSPNIVFPTQQLVSTKYQELTRSLALPGHRDIITREIKKKTTDFFFLLKEKLFWNHPKHTHTHDHYKKRLSFVRVVSLETLCTVI